MGYSQLKNFSLLFGVASWLVLECNFFDEHMFGEETSD